MIRRGGEPQDWRPTRRWPCTDLCCGSGQCNEMKSNLKTLDTVFCYVLAHRTDISKSQVIELGHGSEICGFGRSLKMHVCIYTYMLILLYYYSIVHTLWFVCCCAWICGYLSISPPCLCLPVWYQWYRMIWSLSFLSGRVIKWSM